MLLCFCCFVFLFVIFAFLAVLAIRSFTTSSMLAVEILIGDANHVGNASDAVEWILAG